MRHDQLSRASLRAKAGPNGLESDQAIFVEMLPKSVICPGVRPIFDRVDISLNQTYFPGKSFSIKTLNNSGDNWLIKNILLNGKALKKPVLRHSQIVKGGELVLDLGK